MLRIGICDDEEIILDEIQKNLEKTLAEQKIFSLTSAYYFNVIVISFKSVHFLSSMRYYTQETFFLALRNKNPLKVENQTFL